MAEARHGAIDQPWKFFLERLEAKSKLFHRAAAIIFDQHIGTREQSFQDLAVAVRLQIQSDGFLAAIDAHEIAGLGFACRCFHKRTDMAAVVAANRLFDLDNSGPQLVEHQRGVWSGKHACQIDDKDAVKRSAHDFNRASPGMSALFFLVQFVPTDVSFFLLAARLGKLAHRLGHTMFNPSCVGLRRFFGTRPVFTRAPQIDDFCHVHRA